MVTILIAGLLCLVLAVMQTLALRPRFKTSRRYKIVNLTVTLLIFIALVFLIVQVIRAAVP